jgi:hypothetical protein
MRGDLRTNKTPDLISLTEVGSSLFSTLCVRATVYVAVMCRVPLRAQSNQPWRGAKTKGVWSRAQPPVRRIRRGPPRMGSGTALPRISQMVPPPLHHVSQSSLVFSTNHNAPPTHHPPTTNHHQPPTTTHPPPTTDVYSPGQCGLLEKTGSSPTCRRFPLANGWLRRWAPPSTPPTTACV